MTGAPPIDGRGRPGGAGCLPGMPTRRELLTWIAGGTFGVVTGGLSALPAAATDELTVLTGATMIDGTGAPPAPHTVLVLAGDRIVAVGRHPAVPRGVRVIDLGGRHVIPGLWDMHTHGAWLTDTFLPLHVANGITGIRDMGGPPDLHDIRARVDRGELVGPRMVLASHIVDGPHSQWAYLGEGVVEAHTEAEARAAVVAAVRQRADFVKVYSHLFPGPYAAAADEARRQGIPFVGHAPMQLSVQECVSSGQSTLEHLYNMTLSTSGRRDALFERMRSVFAATEDPAVWGRTWTDLEYEALGSYDPATATALYDTLAATGSWQCPTLDLERNPARPAEEILADPRLTDLLHRYIHPQLRAEWLRRVEALIDRPEADLAKSRAVYAAKIRMIGDLERAGVPMVAGTDCWIPFRFPGFSLHDELIALVGAGLSPMRALQTATRDAARCLGRTDTGTIRPGARADVVVLDGDPLADITNVRRVHSVVTRGRYVSPAERSRMLAAAETAAQHDPPT
jgi:amidohydrolase family protein